MSLADGGLTRASRSSGPEAAGPVAAACRGLALSACGDAAGFRPLYGHDRFGRDVGEQLKQVRLCAHPGPGRPAHPQRDDLPDTPAAARAAADPPLEMVHHGIRHLDAGACPGRGAGQIYSCTPRSGWSIPRTRRWCSRARASAAPASSASSRSTPTCAPAKTPRTARRRTIADDLKTRLRLSVPRDVTVQPAAC